MLSSSALDVSASIVIVSSITSVSSIWESSIVSVSDSVSSVPGFAFSQAVKAPNERTKPKRMAAFFNFFIFNLF